MIYYLILISAIIIAYPLVKGAKGDKCIYLAFVFFLLTLYSGGRDYSVGTDTIQFVTSYKYFSGKGLESVDFSQVYEPGFLIYMILLSKISLSPRFFLIVTYVIINYSIIRLIYNNSKDYFVSVLVYVLSCQFLASMCMLRQFLAISIVLLGFNYLLKEKYWKYTIFVLIAVMFHYFSIIFILLIPMRYFKKLKRRFLVVLWLVYLFAFLFVPQIMIYIFNQFTTYSDYIIYLEAHGGLSGELRIPPMIFVLFAILYPFVLNFKKLYYNHDFLYYKGKDYSFMNLLFLFLVLLVILSSRFGLFTRVYYYYTPFLVLVPNLVCKKRLDISWQLYYMISLGSIFIVSMLLKKGTYETENFIFGF